MNLPIINYTLQSNFGPKPAASFLRLYIKFIKSGYHQRLPQMIVPDVMMQNALSYLCNGLMLQGVRVTASQAMRVVSVDYLCCT